MDFKTTIFNKIYKELYLKGVNPKDEKELAKILFYFLDNITLDKNTLLKCIEKEDWYKFKYKKSVNELTNEEKEEVLDIHIDFIATSCDELLNC